jgi:hypothetical protein
VRERIQKVGVTVNKMAATGFFIKNNYDIS